MNYIMHIFAFLSLVNFTNAQNSTTIEKDLKNSFQRIDYWSSEGRDKENAYDSLDVANEKFEKLLLKYTSSNLQTLHYRFKSLEDIGLKMATSEDKKFRIYSWDTRTGGTMRFFKNIFQYAVNEKVFSKTIGENNDDKVDAGCFYFKINDIISEGKKYYIAQSRAILSTGLTSNFVQIFSISNSKLDDKAKLIKTKSGLKNLLVYEVDLTASSNRNNEIRNYGIEYDTKKKIISIPLIQEDSKVTNKRIRYQFNGKYFVKL